MKSKAPRGALAEMSSLLGRPGDRLPLGQAVDELASSARWAGRPSLRWLAGIFYPSLLLSAEAVQGVVYLFERALGLDQGLPLIPAGKLMLPISPHRAISPETFGDLMLVLLVSLPAAAILFRFAVGLALVAAPGRPPGERHGLVTVWAAGRGLGLTALKMWFTLLGLLVAVMVFLIGPVALIIRVIGLDKSPVLLLLTVVPVLILVLAYGLVLQVMNQLALHSLVHNRRGVWSALVHSWRLIRGEPWGAVRSVLMDLTLTTVTVVVQVALGAALPTLVSSPLGLAFQGFVGTTRAAFWARAYRGLGGPLRSDNLPGVEAETP